MILLIICSNVTLKAQVIDSLTESTFESETFKTNEIIGLKDFKYNPIVSTIVLSESTEQTVYGNITTFENGIFSSGNFGPCGNECRVTVSGKYLFKGDKIH
ncbi:MAG: hypothetical protein JKY30_02445, partial [Flavobacteriales bacterium]|nr:hypothetical protein [Flavobacteriales bacterium]